MNLHDINTNKTIADKHSFPILTYNDHYCDEGFEEQFCGNRDGDYVRTKYDHHNCIRLARRPYARLEDINYCECLTHDCEHYIDGGNDTPVLFTTADQMNTHTYLCLDCDRRNHRYEGRDDEFDEEEE